MTHSLARTDAAPRRGRCARIVRASEGVVPEPIAASLRIACEALRASPDEVTCIGVVSHLPHGFVITALVAHAERLAEAYGFRAHMYVHEGRFDVRFERQARPR